MNVSHGLVIFKHDEFIDFEHRVQWMVVQPQAYGGIVAFQGRSHRD